MAATTLAATALLALLSMPAAEAAAAGRQLGAADLARRGRSLIKKGDKKLGRGFVSLALHLDPFLSVEGQSQEFASWLPKFQRSESLTYWKGSIYMGHDKTYLESLFSQVHLFPDGEKNSLALFAWRNLQLTGLSCCGIDNVAVFFQQASKHMYVAPFVDLVPGAGERLKPENINMYRSFRQWWEETGRRPMPEPQVTYHGAGKYEWQAMKVAMKASRMPAGWPELIEAVLASRMQESEAARAILRVALKKNPDLAQIGKDLLPELADMSAVTPPPPAAAAAAAEKYVVCYNPHVGLGNLAVVMVSAHMLAKLTGRTFLLHWNVNTVSQHAFKLREQPGVRQIDGYAGGEEVIFNGSVKHTYLFHMMNSEKLGEVLELFGCSDLEQSLSDYPVVTVSSNLFFAPMLRVNPHTAEGAVPDFPQMLLDLFAPSDRSAKRALDFAKASEWGKPSWWGTRTPVVAIHIRAREEKEDNDDWPTADSPTRGMLDKLRLCLQKAVGRELKGASEFDIFIASTTEAARSAVAKTLQGKVKGLRRVLTMESLTRNRRAQIGAEDAMAEALLISRADVFVRLVVGTSGFSTFAYFSNALRLQNEWVGDATWLKRTGFAPNYLVTEDCGPGRCFLAPPDVRMANIAWHGKQYTQRSCGDVVEKVESKGTSQLGCRGLQPVDSAHLLVEEEL